MQINMITSFSDWTAFAGTWDKQGILRIMSYVKAAGVKKIYWRIFNGGTATYPSKIATVCTGERWYEKMAGASPPGTYDWYKTHSYKNWNSVANAVKIAHEMGVELHGRYTVYEDNHGGGTGSSFTEEHP